MRFVIVKGEIYAFMLHIFYQYATVSLALTPMNLFLMKFKIIFYFITISDCQYDNILKQAKWKAKELQEDLFFKDTHNKGIIKEGLPIVANGWQGSNEIVQALGVKLMKS